MRLVIGGPAYNLMVDTRHAGAMIELVTELQQRAREPLEELVVAYQHAVPVEIARNGLFAQAMAIGATHLWWADADVYWPTEGNAELAWLFEAVATAKIPFATVPVQMRNGMANIWLEPGTRLTGTMTVERRLRRCYATGLGCAVFWLPWYRERWPRGPWFRTDWVPGRDAVELQRAMDAAVRGERAEDMFVSEDYWHTSRLHTHQAAPRFAPICPMLHASRGGIGDSRTTAK